jgi:hypothetical protein
MKGIIFTTFIELVEEKFGLQTADYLIEEAKLQSEGAYTNVGTYDHTELMRMLQLLSEKTKLSQKELIFVYAQKLMGLFVVKYVGFFAGKDLFSFLKSIENHVHVEVRKIYPEAELPTFAIREPSAGELVMEYRSDKPLADLAEGLMRAAIEHFKEKIIVTVEEDRDLPLNHRVFKLKKV